MPTNKAHLTAPRRFSSGWWRFVPPAAIALAAALLLVPSAVRAQEGGPKAAKAEGDKDEEIPKPEDVSLPTADDMKLEATYYAGTKGKNSVPVVLLHGFKGSRKDYAELAPYLQEKLGCAVLVPDLRGHGDSTATKNGGKLSADKMRPQQFKLMVAQDMVAILDFLRQENNGSGKEKPRLNLNKLCIVGADIGADVALQFAACDWSQPPVGKWQMGRFTKALVLLSPEWSAHGLTLAPALKNSDVNSRLSVLLIVGEKGAKPLQDATRVNSMLERHHPAPPAEKKKEQTTLFFMPLKTDLQGTKLVSVKSLGVADPIRDFIERRLIKSDEAKTYTWKRLRKDAYLAEKGE